VIVPTKDRLRYLRTALASVEAQTFRDLDLLVLDDGSVDGAREYLRSYQSAFPFRWLAFEGRERSFLRNTGVRETSGDLIAFLDDDDEWLPEKLAMQVTFLDAKPAVGMLCTRTRVIDEQGCAVVDLTDEHRRLYDTQDRKGRTYATLAAHCVMFTSSILVRRRVFDAVGGYDPAFSACEDLDLYLRVASIAAIECLATPLTRYRVHPGGSASHLNEAQVRVNAKHLEWLDREPGRDPQGDVRRALVMSTARCHYVGRRYRDALRALRSMPRGSWRLLLRPQNCISVVRIIFRFLQTVLARA
jgi:GT2 family glycosyltransferase